MSASEPLKSKLDESISRLERAIGMNSDKKHGSWLPSKKGKNQFSSGVDIDPLQHGRVPVDAHDKPVSTVTPPQEFSELMAEVDRIADIDNKGQNVCTSPLKIGRHEYDVTKTVNDHFMKLLQIEGNNDILKLMTALQNDINQLKILLQSLRCAAEDSKLNHLIDTLVVPPVGKDIG